MTTASAVNETLAGEDTKTTDNKLLDEAWASSARTTAEYMLGRIEERMRALGKQIINYRLGLTQPSEMFYNILADIVGKDNVLQHRIGLDYTTGVMTVLSVISEKCADKLEQIHKAASDLELYLYRSKTCDYQFWVTTDITLDQDLIEYDFPCYRKGD